ncbi:hypothetical protein [Cellulosilyticum ruminicola]|uniref:hypothetical protein n=1 Tax=Cellulosilyticum ruminicola TaxID=425254 RepID=UPI0006D0F0E4|nr:hypothetical protein [Cellulosilyticum ruminicola]
MVKIKKFAPVLLGVMLLTVGCSKNPNKVIDTAIANLSDIQNYTLVMDTKMVTDIEGQEVVIVNSVNETKGTLRPETIMSITDKTELQYGKKKENDETVSYIAKDGEAIAYYEKQGNQCIRLL